MTAPVRISDLTNAAPLDRRGRRLPETLAALDERDKLLIEAAVFFPGVSQREAARQLRIALLRYREGRFRRDRSEALCPSQHAGKLKAVLWAILRTRDHVPSESTIRRALSFS
jgi:hypothetical protein